MSTSKYHRLSFYEAATWDAAVPTSLTSCQHLPALDPPPPDIKQEFDTGNETATDGMASARYPTVRTVKHSVQSRIYTGTAANGNSEAASYCFLMNLLENYFGHAGVAGAGTTVASGGPGVSTPVTLDSASNTAVGDMLIFAAAGGAGTAGEMAVVTALSGAVVTLDRNLSTGANYAASALVYRGFDFRPTLGSYAKTIYLNSELDGHSWLSGPGKITGLKLSGLTSRQGLRYQIEYEGRQWATGITAGTFTQNAYTGAPLVAVGSPIWINGTQTAIADMTVDFGAKHTDIVATSESTGVSGGEIVEVMPSGEITSYYAADRFTEYRAGTRIPLLLWVSNGSTDNAKARGSIGIYVPQAEIDVVEADVNGQRGLKLSWRATRPSSAQVTAGMTAPIYFTVFGGNA